MTPTDKIKESAPVALTLEEFTDRLLAVKNPVVLTHARPDGDTVGTAAALCKIFAALGTPAVYASEKPIGARLSFLVEGLTRAEDPENYTPVAVDVASPAQLGALSRLTEEGEGVALMLDHHRVGTPFAPYYLCADASSAGEVLFSVVEELERRGALTLTREIAAPLFAAISSDTGSFAYSNTSPKTHAIAARLLTLGVDAADIHHRLFCSKSASQVRAEGLIGSIVKFYENTPIAYAAVTRAMREEIGCVSDDFECAVDIVRSLIGCRIALFAKENDDGTYRVSMRSTGPDVAAIAQKFSGGGHIRAAGCSPTGATLAQAAEAVLAELKNTYFPD